MSVRALQMARHYGVTIELSELGYWGESNNLYAEYDPSGPTIRLNHAYMRGLRKEERCAFILHAIGHELYHHCERIGALPRLKSRSAREEAADAFARALLR